MTKLYTGGRSPFTWYPQEYTEQVPMTDMNMRANTSTNFPGRTYRFYTGKTVYSFGHGLSYSAFSNFVVSAPITVVIKPARSILLGGNRSSALALGQAIDVLAVECANLTLDLVVGVRNSGPRDGSHVVLAFWKPASGVAGAPGVQLVGFERVEVARGKTQAVMLSIDVCKGLSLVDSEGNRKLVTGQHTLVIGSPSERQVKHRFNVRLAESEHQGEFSSS